MILVATWETDSVGPVGRELLGAAGDLAEALGSTVGFVSLGDAASTAAADAGRYGARRAFALEGVPAWDAGRAAAALAELARELTARVILLPADEQGGELAPRLAQRVGGTALTHVLGVEVTGDSPSWMRPVFGGKALATVRAVTEPVVATLRRGAFDPATDSGGPTAVEVRVAGSPTGGLELLGRETPETGASLEDASVIVSGGAGLGSAEAFAELEELAQLLGGVVGASLAAVDAGWAPPDRQVGLTGKSVSPDVYFAFGISGASQHLAGIGGAKVVVAVNTDPEAPIFGSARLGAITDGRELVAALAAELRRRRGD